MRIAYADRQVGSLNQAIKAKLGRRHDEMSTRGRGHSGLCGIPPRITLGFKIGIGGLGGLGGGMRQASSSLRTEIKHGKPKTSKTQHLGA